MKSRVLAVVWLACVVCGFAVGICSVPDVEAVANPAAVSVVQSETENVAGVFVTNRKSTDTVSVVAEKRGGAYIAFYRGKESIPRLAISADGLQVRDEFGKVRFIGLRELASLDDSPEEKADDVARGQALIRATRENAESEAPAPIVDK